MRPPRGPTLSASDAAQPQRLASHVPSSSQGRSYGCVGHCSNASSSVCRQEGLLWRRCVPGAGTGSWVIATGFADAPVSRCKLRRRWVQLVAVVCVAQKHWLQWASTVLPQIC